MGWMKKRFCPGCCCCLFKVTLMRFWKLRDQARDLQGTCGVTLVVHALWYSKVPKL
jgi:hypothetical protein